MSRPSDRTNRTGEGKHSPRRIAAALKQAEALQYRKAGLSYSQIAAHLGLAGKQGAHYCVTAALRRVLKQPSDSARQLEIGRLDAMLVPVFPIACRGDAQAVGCALAIMVRRARLLGLDAPVNTEHGIPSATDAPVPSLHLLI